jgi:pimeloyl-ACP methyl ester carboxylesterase
MITDHEAEQVIRANEDGRVPIVFVHGLWLLPSSWDRWATVFAEAGYAPLTPGWPDDPQTVEEANASPDAFANKTVGDVADHFAELIAGLSKKPAIVGHSFGGLLAQILAGRGLAAASVAIDPAPFRGVLPLPISSLKSARPVLGNPANRNRAVPLPTNSSASHSPMPSARTRRRSCIRRSRFPPRASRSSRPQRRISTPGPR